MWRASAIMWVLKDGLDQHLRGLPVTGRRSCSIGFWALPLAVGPRWYGRAGGTPGGRGDVGQQPAHHAIWIREKPDGVSPAAACSARPCSLPAADCLPPRLGGLCLPACRGPCAALGLATDGRRPPGPRFIRIGARSSYGESALR